MFSGTLGTWNPLSCSLYVPCKCGDPGKLGPGNIGMTPGFGQQSLSSISATKLLVEVSPRSCGTCISSSFCWDGIHILWSFFIYENKRKIGSLERNILSVSLPLAPHVVASTFCTFWTFLFCLSKFLGTKIQNRDQNIWNKTFWGHYLIGVVQKLKQKDCSESPNAILRWH